MADLTELIRQSALEAVQELLGGTAASAPRRGRKPAANAKPPSAKPARKKAARKKTGKRVRRTIDEIAATSDALLVEVRRNPGSGFGSLCTALDLDGKDLRRPLNDLLAAGAIRKEGEKRGTKYFPGKGKPVKKKAAKRKTSKKQAARKKTAKKKAAR